MITDTNGIPAATEAAPTTVDDPIERQINIALEAQDGPASPNTETPGGEQSPKEGEATPSVDGKDSNGSGSNNTAQQQPKQEAPKEGQQAVGPKDLRLADGTVVKGGSERRFYEQRETARQQAQHYQQQLQTERQERQRIEGELRTLRETAQQLNGVDPQSLRIGAQIVTDLQRDPVGTMKKLLAEVISQGHTIEGISAGVDHLAVQRFIDQRLPQQTTPTEPSEQEIEQQAREEVTRFYSTYPDARPHDALLGRMLRDNPGVDLDTAYFELKNAFAEKGFDWSRTLEENLQGASSQQQQQSAQPQPQPMPHGRPMTQGMAPANEVKIAHEDTDMGDIVRQAMRESGLKV